MLRVYTLRLSSNIFVKDRICPVGLSSHFLSVYLLIRRGAGVCAEGMTIYM